MVIATNPTNASEYFLFFKLIQDVNNENMIPVVRELLMQLKKWLSQF